MLTASQSDMGTEASPEVTESLETPFLEVYEGPLGYEQTPEHEAGPMQSPFVSEYTVGGETVGGAATSYRELLAELYDSELDETLADLVDEADSHAQLLGLDEQGANPARVERALEQWLEPLRQDAEALLESMGEALDGTQTESMSDSELDELLDRFEPQEASGGPVFEDFLKKVWKKAKSAVKGAVKLAKKGIAAVGKILPIGFILKKLKALVKPLLTRVLKIALNKLPAAVRPAAAQLAKRFLGVQAEDSELDESAQMESPAAPDLRALQLGFDTEVASLLLAPAEPELEAFAAEATVEAERLDDSSLTELDHARERFISGVMELEDGEDPTPLVEQFVPAILGALRLGISVIGRSKVVGFLAKFLGRLIAPYVGPTMTPPLSKAIVDAGLRLMTLEAGEDEAPTADPRLAAEAFAALVEDTVARVSELEEDELEDEGIIEEVAFEGFHRAARGQFPAQVLRRGAVAGRSGGVWLAMPRRTRPRYRKYSRVLDITISPEAAALVNTRAGQNLATFLRDRFGRTGPVRARVHLYQAVPGTRLGRIARAERSVPGLGPAAVRGRTELHPLTREAAGALLGEPELGEDVSEAFLDELAPAAVGQRFYYLEVAGGRPSATGTSPPGTQHPRISKTSAAIDTPRGELRVAIYLGEAQAQDIAAQLRRNEPLGAVLNALRPVYAGGFRSLSSRSGRRHVRVVGEAHEQAIEEQFVRLPGLSSAGDTVARLLSRWTRRALASQLRGQRDAFLAAAAAPSDGVTMIIRFSQVPGLATVARLMRGGGALALRDAGPLPQLIRAQAPTASLEVVAGHRNA